MILNNHGSASIVALLAASLWLARSAFADDAATGTAGAGDDAANNGVAAQVYGNCDPAPGQDHLVKLDDLRAALDQSGIKAFAVETAETLGNPSGGVRTGAIFEGRLQAGVCVSLGKTPLGWSNSYIYADAFQIHGRGLSGNDLHNLFTVSNIEASRATRLHDLYFEQGWFGDTASVRIGQLAADDEFITSEYGNKFVNAMFGWPGLPSNDLPGGGGPIYPLSTPGLRVRYGQNGDGWAVLAAVFNGNPAGPQTSGNMNPVPQLRDPDGLAFNFNSDVFAIAEAQYGPGQPTTYKLGAWYHSGKFADQRFDTGGLSLASPLSSGIPRTDVNDYSLYAVVDQTISGDGDSGVAGFLRAMGAPADRNLVSFYVDGGLNVFAPFAQKGDVAALGFAFGHVSSAVQSLDRDFATLAGTPRPVQDYEAAVELTYQRTVAAGLQLQPDFQYVIHPGGHAQDPTDPTGRTAINDAVVLGLRATVTF
ncbi:MAG TPA: carbohydrate porin [Stellaceae bacterium]|jgi:porin|nr:carbohydrate porin [Stellaceae bacterium]